MRCVVVTGAGASRDLGRKGPLPLMGDWSNALRRDLNGREHGLADAIGLKTGMTSQEFEAALGSLLRWREMWPVSHRYRGLGVKQLGQMTAGLVQASKLEERRLAEVMSGINNSLFEMFSAAEISEEKAIDAYGNLLEALGSPDDLVVVTTNYDPSAEIALSGLGRHVDTGFDRPPGRAPSLNPHGLVERVRSARKSVGVLHLHGAVGWYEKGSTVFEQHQDQPFNETLGRPVVLYPDPEKDPTRDALVQSLWEEFDIAIEGATHVLVIGHSLNDRALVSKLRAAAQIAHVAVCLLDPHTDPDGRVGVDPAVHSAEAKRARMLIPGKSLVVPVRFGPTPGGDFGSIREWAKGMN